MGQQQLLGGGLRITPPPAVPTCAPHQGLEHGPQQPPLVNEDNGGGCRGSRWGPRG